MVSYIHMKVLTVIIPAYNTELYIERCLDSLLYHPDIIKDLELIVVNDGSSDKTLEIAANYQNEYPDTVKVINKENGGHGSTVNAGVAAATGKYLRVIDSDDWVNIIDFPEYIKNLKNEKADIVVTNYIQDILYDETTHDFIFSKKDDVSEAIDISTIANLVKKKNFFFEFSMHSMTVKTENLKRVWGEGLLEKTFYVDQQYVAKALISAKNYTKYNLDIYRYFIGRPEQSVSAGGFFDHRQDHERVLRWLLKTTKETEDKTLNKVFTEQTYLMLKTHYDGIYLSVSKLTASEKRELLSFDKYLSANYPELHNKLRAAKHLTLRLSPLRKSHVLRGIAHAKRKRSEND